MRILLFLFAATEVVLHNFAGPPATGADPLAGLASDAAGNLYGTTPDGGAGNSGVVFKINPAGGETVLYSFTGGADGGSPQAGVTLDSAGNIYGTTSAGGGKAGAGVVFKLDPSGHETVLYAFTGGADGSAPYAGVIRDASGNLYGTTRYGGAMGLGTVYKLDTSGHETALYSFKGGTDGYGPMSGLVLDPAGNLYGTMATANGCNCSGIVYKVDPSGNQTILYSFTDAVHGGFPSGGLIIDAAGNLYGTASFGGIIGSLVASGVVYRVSPSGQETVLYTFSGGADGGGPYGGWPRTRLAICMGPRAAARAREYGADLQAGHERSRDRAVQFHKRGERGGSEWRAAAGSSRPDLRHYPQRRRGRGGDRVCSDDERQ